MPPVSMLWAIVRNPAFWALLFSPTAVHWAAVEVVIFYWPNVADGIRKSVWYMLPALFLCGLIAAWPKSKFKRKISGTDIEVAIKVGSIFRSKNPLVIGATTHFDFATDDHSANPSISPKSVQGQFQAKYFERPADIGTILENEKRKLSAVSTSTSQEKPFGPKLRYAVGEVVVVAAKKRCAYFVTMSTLNSHRTGQLSLDDYFDLIPKMWNGIRSKGGMEPLDIPLLGARFGRTGLKLEQTLTLLVRSFVAASRESKFVDEVTFYVSGRDYLKGEFSAEKLVRILDRECNHEKIDVRAPNPGSLQSAGVGLP